MKSKFLLFFENVNNLLQRFLTRISVGVIVGFTIGIGFLLIFQTDVSESVIFISAAFAGVFAEIFVRFTENVFILRNQLKPLNRVLGTIASDDSWIYISAWRRNLDDIEHSQLFRNDPDKQDQPLIVGSKYVYGRGDAIALSYIRQAIEKASKGKTQIFVEDSESTHNRPLA